MELTYMKANIGGYDTREFDCLIHGMTSPFNNGGLSTVRIVQLIPVQVLLFCSRLDKTQ